MDTRDESTPLGRLQVLATFALALAGAMCVAQPADGAAAASAPAFEALAAQLDLERVVVDVMTAAQAAQAVGTASASGR